MSAFTSVGGFVIEVVQEDEPVAKLPLSQTVDASLAHRSVRGSMMSLLTSTAVQLVAIAVLVVTPLLVAQTMPEPMSRLTLPQFVSVQVQPPVSPGPEAPAEPVRTSGPEVPTIRLDSVATPVVVPDGIPENDSYFERAALGGVAGVPGGVSPGSGGSGGAAGTPAPLPPQTEEAPELLRISGDLRPPRKIVHVNPIYPAMARAARVQGTVVVEAVIDIDGSVSNLSVVKSVALLDHAAMDAVRQWRYEPTQLGGRPVAVIMTVEVKFQLR